MSFVHAGLLVCHARHALRLLTLFDGVVRVVVLVAMRLLTFQVLL